MRKSEEHARDPMAWAGSKLGSEVSALGLLPEIPAGDIYKLRQIRHKLEDEGYVDDAVSRIASYLSGTISKKEKHER